MARIDRKRLDGATFPTTLSIQTRFADLDAQGHVNNAAAAVILQEARVDLNRAAGLLEIRSVLRPVVAALNIEYAREMYFPEPIEIGSGILGIGRTSVTIGQVARQRGEPALYAETVLVMVDDAGPATLPDALRTRYERLLVYR